MTEKSFEPERMLRDLKRIERLRSIKMLMIPLAALFVLILAIAYFQPKVISMRAFSSFATDAAPLLTLAMGASLVILIGGIDLSIANMASFAAVTFVLMAPALEDYAFIAVLLLAAFIGGCQGLVHSWAQIPSFVVSFGTLGILYGTTHYISNATAAPLTAPSAVIAFLGARTGVFPNGIFVVAIVAAVLILAMRYTRLGRDIYAVGSAERAAYLSGVRTTRVRVIVFAISGVCAALAGLLLLSQTSYSSPAMANNYLLPAIVGVVVGGVSISGGVGGIGSALIGGMIAVGVRLGTVIIGLNPAYQNIVFGIVILVAVALTIDREKIGIIK
ncbi:Ribose ABC transporter, permease protein [Agrobacterium tumefaciens str. Kerr 14]|uniref:Ribose ABC transporter, permease protein n=1 Tax=Agrobacterium tumefaciens str. Kerr 14 TaxID=1183424 RepID=A0A1S7SAN6_AGRTU|nr:ABC transporter permease [Agrobacterium tumefaciens]CUX65248.1 Ribose ABC transporter, permease protein [Agrobacterium tumefaciens str. Kerr 14]